MIALTWLAAFATSPREAPAETSAVVRGELEPGFDSVVSLGVGPLSVCTGNLITPRVVLSAAHCSGEIPLEAVVQLGTASFGSDVTEPVASVRLSDAFLHPGYVPLGQEGVGDLGEFDLAVVVLAEDAPVRPVRFRTEPLTEAEVGSEVVSVGFGIDENGVNGVKRSATLTVSDLDPMFVISDSSDNGGSNICSGDSGGPQFGLEDGEWVQWAVHSWADANCSITSGSTRTDVAAEWIVDQVEAVHGTRDLCMVSGRYDDGVCDRNCLFPDPDCVPGLQLDDGVEEAAGTCSTGMNRFCPPLLGILVLGLTRRRTA